ncbi:MAG: isoprenylcysteine carboxylmethyltransferase family protein [Acidobacteriota bacterium]
MNWKIKFGNFLFKYRSFTPIPLIVFVFLLFSPVNYGHINLYIDLGGISLLIFGELIRILSVGFSFTGTSGRENYLRADKLNTSGIYSVVRNPLYIGNIFIYSGLLIVFSNIYALLFFVILLIVQYYFIILSEQEYLKVKYGESYKKYCSEVRSIIPGFRNRRRAENKFNLKKVLFKENDSVFNSLFLLGLVLIFKYKIFYSVVKNTKLWILYFSILIMLYILIKIIKRRK